MSPFFVLTFQLLRFNHSFWGRKIWEHSGTFGRLFRQTNQSLMRKTMIIALFASNVFFIVFSFLKQNEANKYQGLITVLEEMNQKYALKSEVLETELERQKALTQSQLLKTKAALFLVFETDANQKSKSYKSQ